MKNLKKFNFTDNEIKKLEKIAISRLYQPQELIIKEGERDRSLIIIENGIVEVVIHIDSQRKAVATLNSGDIIGELNFTIPLHRSADVRAVELTETLIFNYHELCKLLESDDSLAVKFFQAINLLLINKIHKML